MDAVFFTVLCNELKNELVDAKIQRIEQPGETLVRVHLRKPGKNLVLCISADGELPGIYLGSKPKGEPLPKVPPSFCMLLRRRIGGGRITQVFQPDLERICGITITAGDELGNNVSYTLLAEIMGRRSNVLLLDASSRIAGVMRPVSESHNRYRQLLPGYTYVSPPPVNKSHISSVTPDQIVSGTGSTNASRLLSSVSGVGPLLARYICKEAGALPDSQFHTQDAGTLAAACHKTWEAALSSTGSVVCASDSGGFCHVLPLECSGLIERHATVSLGVEQYLLLARTKRGFFSRQRSLVQALSSRMERLEKRILAREKDMSEAVSKEQYRKAGDLVLTYMAEVQRAIDSHRTEITLDDPETDAPVAVPLDLSVDAAQNAQRLYRRYQKARATIKSLAPQIAVDRTEYSYLESIMASIHMAEKIEDLGELESELKDQGILERKRSDTNQPKTSMQEFRSEPLSFPSSSGDEIIVGRNNRQNEMVTFRLSRVGDIWLHAKGIPGAHVLVRPRAKAHSQSSDVDPESLYEAATLAAYFSSGRSSTKIEVDYTAVRNVKKMPGGKTGMVIYEHYKTLSARPGDALALISANSTQP